MRENKTGGKWLKRWFGNNDFNAAVKCDKTRFDFVEKLGPTLVGRVCG